MAFLFNPKARAFADESLESYILRIVAENFFESFTQLSLAVREELHELDYEAHGAFPLELEALNVYHSQHNSHFRMRALGLLESLLDLPHYEIQKLALLRSDMSFVGSVAAVFRDDVDIPRSFLREVSATEPACIPVCPDCLKGAPYIRQHWHFSPINTCLEHGCTLISECPECGLAINYIEQECITHCSCGFYYADAPTAKPSHKLTNAAKCLLNRDSSSINPLFSEKSQSARYAALLWHHKRYGDTEPLNAESVNQAITYFVNWPQNFYQELDELTEKADVKLIDLFNKTAFSFIYGDVIKSVQVMVPEPSQHHFIKKALINYLSKLLASYPKSKQANTADLLLSVSETAIVLACSHEQVYRLHQDGILKCRSRTLLRQRINPNQAVFHLRQVLELLASYGVRGQRMYRSAW